MTNVSQEFHECARVVTESAHKLAGPLEEAIELCHKALAGGGTVLTCGNGGSAADAQHLTAELVCRYRTDRRALPSIALTANSSNLTAIGNDYGFDRIFARQVEAFARPGDLAIAISTSGESGNVLEAARVARDLGCGVGAMTGAGGGTLAELADALFAVPSQTVARIQEMHELCLHALAARLEKRMMAGRQE